MMRKTCNPSTWEMELLLDQEFKASMGYMRLS